MRDQTHAGPGATRYGEAISQVVDPSAAAGGTLTLDLAGEPDSTDYQDSSEKFMWDFMRLYSMQLLTYQSCPGPCGDTLVPDLATGPGEVSDGGLVWTYHLRSGVRFQDGDPVTAQDVKYGIERSYARGVLPLGPGYFQSLLTDQGYPGPYADPARDLMGLASITTPTASTIQFHLIAPFADFNYLVATPLTTPVEPKWDSGAHAGASFALDPESTGPYEFQHYAPGRELVLVRNPDWDRAADPQASQLADTIVVHMGLTQDAVSSALLAGAADLDLSGAGLSPAATAQALGTPSLAAAADDAVTGTLSFAYLNLQVIPNVHCREAIEYAADKTTLQAAYGGQASGQIAGTVLPPDSIGYGPADPYGAVSAPAGDLAAARAQLAACGSPHGFTTGIAYRRDLPREAQAARALQAALARVGIRGVLHGYLSYEYYSQYAGVPGYVDSHDLGIVLASYSAYVPDGYGFLDALANGDAIAAAGNVNIAALDDQGVNGLFTRALADASPAGRAAIWTQIDQRVMALAAILPIVDQKAVLYRGPDLTNVYVDAYYGMYNYAVLGVR